MRTNKGCNKSTTLRDTYPLKITFQGSVYVILLIWRVLSYRAIIRTLALFHDYVFISIKWQKHLIRDLMFVSVFFGLSVIVLRVFDSEPKSSINTLYTVTCHKYFTLCIFPIDFNAFHAILKLLQFTHFWTCHYKNSQFRIYWIIFNINIVLNGVYVSKHNLLLFNFESHFNLPFFNILTWRSMGESHFLMIVHI